MSTSRGSNIRKRPQKHQNRTAFKNDLHDTSHQTKFINALEVTGVCKRCKDIIEWKIKYKKYKTLTAPRKCVGCEQKTVKYAYHMLCTQCAVDKNICAKCCKTVEGQANMQTLEEVQKPDLKTMLKDLPERKRRTILRVINKQEEGQQNLTPELKAEIEDILSKMDNIDLEDYSQEFSDEDSQSENENDPL